MKQTPRSPRGFALISALAVLTILVILVVAFASTMRTERSASQNFMERERAQAVGQAMLNRIMADHAAPEVSIGGKVKPLAPFEVDKDTKLPTPATEAAYIKDPAMGVYVIEPMPEVSSKNKLLRISLPKANADGTAETRDAYQPEDWAWARQRDVRELLPLGKDQSPIAPKWVDYVEERAVGGAGNMQPIPVGEVAFAIWDESGSIDINLAGRDDNVNGMAPHNLGFEQLALDPAKFVQLLDRQNGRQRSNFSLREISKKATNNTGDDKWFFSAEEMMVQNLFSPENIQKVTTISRDFDVRPEWDGNRGYVEAEKFLKSYINNEKLFKLFTNQKASAQLVRATLDERQLKAVLKSVIPAKDIGADEEDWMQIMRLLAALRLSLPVSPVPDVKTSLPMNQWTDSDVYGIALNIMQAAAPASDQNLFAYDRNKYTIHPYNDPHVRMGVRVAPYITESAVEAKRISATQVQMTQYMELWNPYPYALNKPNGQPIRYHYGNWTGSEWDAKEPWKGSITALGTRWTLPGTPPTGGQAITAPGPGEFRVIKLPTKTYTLAADSDLVVRTRPYLQNADYWDLLVTDTSTVEQSSSYSITIAPFFTNGGSDAEYNLIHSFAKDDLEKRTPGNPNEYAPVWHSFQIDDPRMGPFNRYTPYGATIGNIAQSKFRTNETPMKYSWKAFPRKHSLYGIAADPKSPETKKHVSKYGDGYNENFGENWPPFMDFDRAMATFALPMRPFQNVGELGSVFANRPWRTLSFAETTVPTDPTVKLAGAKMQNVPTALLDYLTTIGTTSDLTTLNYKLPGSSPSENFNTAALNARKQDKRWLFEAVDKEGRPAGPLRPIRGRINLNSASRETIKRLLSAPYRLPRSLGLQKYTEARPAGGSSNDLLFTVAEADADLIAREFEGDGKAKVNSVRPLRAMADLSRLTSIKTLHEKYPDPVVDAMVARLAQFGTVRQQIYTVDMIARSLNTKQEQKRLTNPNLPRIVTAEVRFQARVYFDTFSRKGFVESIEYR